MDIETLLMCLFIVGARVLDVSLGTIRTVFVVNGKRGVAFVLGFFEVLIWVVVVSQVITNLHHPLYAISYALGFACGNYVGMTIERWVAVGEQVLRVFTRNGRDVANGLRAAGHSVTEFHGSGRDGPLDILLIQTARRGCETLAQLARTLDPQCYYIVDDVRTSSTAASGGLRNRWMLQRK